MEYLPLFFFGIAALLGLYLLSFVIRKLNTPKAIALVHGFFASCGLITLIVYAFHSFSTFGVSLILFLLTATGGFYLFMRDITGKGIPLVIALFHGGLALTSFVVLFLAIRA